MGTGSEAHFYTGLVAELYEPLRSEVPDPEPFARFIARSGEPALELGCGGGDPLLDLRERGLDVEGVDSSPDMLERCRSAARRRGLDVTLHEQTMQELRLGRRFRSVFLAGATFNLLPDDAAAGSALARLAEHLEPGGSALVPLMVPEPTPLGALGRAREHTADDGTLLRVTALSQDHDERRRVQTTVLRYEVLREGDVVDRVERPWLLHWYTRDGFAALARDAGLDVVTVMGPDGSPATADSRFVVTILA